MIIFMHLSVHRGGNLLNNFKHTADQNNQRKQQQQLEGNAKRIHNNDRRTNTIINLAGMFESEREILNSSIGNTGWKPISVHRTVTNC